MNKKAPNIDDPVPGELFFARAKSKNREKASASAPVKRVAENLVALLGQREIGIGQHRLRKLGFVKPLSNMRVLSNKRWNATKGQWKSWNTSIDRRSIYLGFSPDSTMLVQLSIDGGAGVEEVFDEQLDSSNASLFVHRLIVHLVSPQHLEPAYELNLGKRFPCSILHVGFSPNNRLMCVSSLPRSYLRMLDNGFLHDIGSAIVAVTFTNRLETSASLAMNQQIFALEKGDSLDEEGDNHSCVDGAHLKGIKLSSGIPEKCRLSFRWRVEPLSRPYSPNQHADKQPQLYLIESWLNAERVIETVASSAVKRSLGKSYYFRGVRAAEAYVCEVGGSVVTVVAFGVAEFQSQSEYHFMAISSCLTWSFGVNPGKITLLKWEAKEGDWRSAISEDDSWWQPKQLPTVLRPEDRLLTNDVLDSLRFLRSHHSGGMVFTM